MNGNQLIFRLCHRDLLRERANGYVRSDGIVSTHCNALRHHLADRGHAPLPQVHQLPVAVNKEHGIDESDSGQRLADLKSDRLLRFHRHVHLD